MIYLITLIIDVEKNAIQNHVNPLIKEIMVQDS